jgi:hypothetical protein
MLPLSYWISRVDVGEAAVRPAYGYRSVAPRRRWRRRPIVVVIRWGRFTVMMRRRPVIIEVLARRRGPEAMRWR